ncbi:MAG: hypothetical protein V1767_04950 [Chloroflexota bacterium]
MSRKISIQEKKRWLEMFELGMTENQVAKKVKRDLRTIVSGLQEASRDRHLANAEAEMLRNALLNHQNQLMNVLRNISNMLVLPPAHLELREENSLLLPIPLSGSLIEETPEKEITLRTHDEDKLEWELLQEHLKSDKLWNYLKRWRQAMIDYIGTRRDFKQAIKSSLENKTKLRFERQGKEKTEYLLPITVDLLYGVATNRILGVKDATNLEENIKAGSDESVRHGTTELAHCKDAAKCRDRIISVFLSLSETPAGFKVKSTYAELATVTRLARRHVDEILLLGMVTGKCRVCARLGR